jgi:hypothetical protein
LSPFSVLLPDCYVMTEGEVGGADMRPH